MNSPAPYFASDRVFEVLVRSEEVAEASEVLRQARSQMPRAFRREWEPMSRTPKARAFARGCLMTGIIVALAAIVISLAVGAVMAMS